LANVERYRSSESRDVRFVSVTAGGWEHISGIDELLNIDEHLLLTLASVADLGTAVSSTSPLGQTTVMSPVLSTSMSLIHCSLFLPVSVRAVLLPQSDATALSASSFELHSEPAA